MLPAHNIVLDRNRTSVKQNTHCLRLLLERGIGMEMNSGTNRPDYRRQASRYRSNTGSGRRDMYGNMSYGSRPCGCGREAEKVEMTMDRGCGCSRESESSADCGCQERPAYYMGENRKKKDCPKVSSKGSAFEEMYPVGMAYVPMQEFTDLYEIGKGFQRGTVFAQLDYPFLVGFCAGRCGCK